MSKYEQVIDLIKKNIAQGTWPPGTWLPSQAVWRETYGVSYGTLRGAYLILKSQGVLIGRQGDGVYVAGAEPLDLPETGGRGAKRRARQVEHTFLDESGQVQYGEGHYSGDGCIRRHGA